jgi:hypothetical protein
MGALRSTRTQAHPMRAKDDELLGCADAPTLFKPRVLQLGCEPCSSGVRAAQTIFW